MKLCKKCIIPDSFPNIDFINGICGFCRNGKQFTHNKITKGYDKLVEILRSKRADTYSCIVPVSGGKDSTYILLYSVRELGLKPLALFVDSAFVSEFSKKNVENACRKLSVDLIVVKSTNFRRKAVREALHISKHTNKLWVDGICCNCESNLRTAAINEATKRKIPFILWGSTDFEDVAEKYKASWEPGQFREEFGKKKTDFLHLLKAISYYAKAGTLNHALKYGYLCIRDNIDTNAPEGWRKFSPYLHVSFRNKKVQTIYFYDYIAYNPSKQIEILKRELTWEAPPNKEARMDCKLHCFGNCYFLRRTGITRDGFILANLVREGLMTQADAIEKEKTIKESLKTDCQKVLKELGFHDYDLVCA